VAEKFTDAAPGASPMSVTRLPPATPPKLRRLVWLKDANALVLENSVPNTAATLCPTAEDADTDTADPEAAPLVATSPNPAACL
jgi:hypothetical protein